MNKNETNIGNEGMSFKNMNLKYIVIYISYLVNHLLFHLNFLFYFYVSIAFVIMLIRPIDCIFIHKQQERYKFIKYIYLFSFRELYLIKIYIN